MADMKIFTRNMVCVMRPLLDQVELYSAFSSSSDYYNFPSPEVEDMCSPLLQQKDQTLSKDIYTLKVTLRDFYDAVDSIKKNKRCSNEEKIVFTKLIHNVHKMLLKKDSIIVQSIQSVITKCESSFMNFMNAEYPAKQMFHLKAFAESCTECLALVKSRSQDLVILQQRQQLLLCVRQIAKCLPLVAEGVRSADMTDKEQPLHVYVVSRISWCLRELSHAVGCSFEGEGEAVGGQFVSHMDTALLFLSQLQEDCKEHCPTTTTTTSASELRTAIEEVLCHAMSIGHVAVEEDSTSIQRSCHKVLRALESLSRGLQEPPAMVALLRGALADALERLERQVNAALLRLLLEVFSEVFVPLKTLLDACDEPQYVEKRSIGSLDKATQAFDLQVDRIMQLGLFAVACSQDSSRVVGLRSCLASLESMEPELVPAVAALFLEPSNAKHRAWVKALVIHWTQEVKELKALLHGIVDPQAFCQVALEEAVRLAARVKAAVPAIPSSALHQPVRRLISMAGLAARQLHISLQEEFGPALPHSLLKPSQDFYFACNELEAMQKQLLGESCAKEISAEDRRRLMQRCELVASTLKRLQEPLAQAAEASANSGKENVRPQREASKDTGADSTTCGSKRSLLFPDSVRDLPLDQDSTLFDVERDEFLRKDLTVLAQRGRQLINERSVLYCTPRKQRPLVLLAKSNTGERSSAEKNFAKNHSARSRQKISNTSMSQRLPVASAVTNSQKIPDSPFDGTLGLDITNILENLTLLSNTLTSVRHHDPNDSKDANGRDCFTAALAAAAFSGCSSELEAGSLLSSLKDSPAAVTCSTLGTLEGTQEDTLQRLDDLQAVQERIARLKAEAS